MSDVGKRRPLDAGDPVHMTEQDDEVTREWANPAKERADEEPDKEEPTQ